eukprot:scaffold1307_cov200-Pinguiococcus_pyrenoidosus.AAC.63
MPEASWSPAAAAASSDVAPVYEAKVKQRSLHRSRSTLAHSGSRRARPLRRNQVVKSTRIGSGGARDWDRWSMRSNSTAKRSSCCPSTQCSAAEKAICSPWRREMRFGQRHSRRWSPAS